MRSAVGNRGEPRIEEPTRAQRTIARRAAESRATVPDIECSAEVDMRCSLELREAGAGSLPGLLIRAVALALRDVPRVNGGYRDGHFELYPRVNVAVALGTVDAYVLATVFDADTKSAAELSHEAAALSRRAAAGELTPPELSGSTFSLTDLSDTMVVAASPVIVAPHAAALTAGGVRPAALSQDGALVAGHVMTITLACDHRMLYAREAAAFLVAAKMHLEGSSR